MNNDFMRGYGESVQKREGGFVVRMGKERKKHRRSSPKLKKQKPKKVFLEFKKEEEEEEKMKSWGGCFRKRSERD